MAKDSYRRAISLTSAEVRSGRIVWLSVVFVICKTHSVLKLFVLQVARVWERFLLSDGKIFAVSLIVLDHKSGRLTTVY